MKFYEMQKVMLDSLNDPAKKAMLPTEIENKISECNTVCAVLIKHFAHYLEVAEKEKHLILEKKLEDALGEARKELNMLVDAKTYNTSFFIPLYKTKIKTKDK